MNILFLTKNIQIIYKTYNIPDTDTATTRITRLLTSKRNNIPATIYKQLTEYILSNNFFTFQRTINKQENGIAMGNPAGGAIENVTFSNGTKSSWTTRFTANISKLSSDTMKTASSYGMALRRSLPRFYHTSTQSINTSKPPLHTARAQHI